MLHFLGIYNHFLGTYNHLLGYSQFLGYHLGYTTIFFSSMKNMNQYDINTDIWGYWLLKKVWWLKTIHCGIQQAAGLVEILDLGPVMMAFCTLAYDIKGYNRKKTCSDLWLEIWSFSGYSQFMQLSRENYSQPPNMWLWIFWAIHKWYVRVKSGQTNVITHRFSMWTYHQTMPFR